MVMDNSLRGRDLLSIADLSAKEIQTIFKVSAELKALTLPEQMANPILPGKSLAMIFEKPSLRTRVTFELGMMHLGGHAVYLQPTDIRMGVRETIHDVARNLERWVQGIMARTFLHKSVTDLAKYADIPVINGLSDLEHPCQALADFFTILEHKGRVDGIKVAYLGDGNNICHSLMLLAGLVGADMVVGCPAAYQPDAEVTKVAQRFAASSGGAVNVTNDPREAAAGADVLYTDVWASMGQEAEQEERLPVFMPYQVNQALVELAKSDVIVMHDMPAKRGQEITDEVIDGPHSVVFDEAENRLHAQKAVMALLM